MKALNQIILFAISGAIGFFVDVLVLYLFISISGAYKARMISFTCAVVVTWFFNRSLTFRSEAPRDPLIIELAKYFALMLVGGIVNYSVYAIMISQYEYIRFYPILGVATGSLLGMTVNFLSSKYLVWG